MMKWNRVLFLLVSLLFMFSQASFASAEPIDEVRTLIDMYYVEDVPETTLAKPTIKAITDQLDPYSTYLTEEEFEQLTFAIDQELVGIGIVMQEDQQGAKILHTIPDGPAEMAGLQVDDIITAVDGKTLAGESIDTVVSLLSGEEETSVTITFFRPSTGETSTQTIEREHLSLPNVEANMLGGDIGYIQLYSFSEDAADEIQAAIKNLADAKAFILDLRDNGGGYVNAAQEVVGLFPNLDSAYQLRDRTEKPEIYRAIKQKMQFTVPVHLLINENSASASEMVSAAVQEQNGATLYGQTTYGKGSMQVVFALSDLSALKLTIAEFYSPSGKAINEIGVTPDIPTALGDELVLSHRDQLMNLYQSYEQLPARNEIKPTETFTIDFPTDLNWATVSADEIQLIHLGGAEVEVELQMAGYHTVKVQSKEPLLENENYLLVLHPDWLTQDNQQLDNGLYFEISVN